MKFFVLSAGKLLAVRLEEISGGKNEVGNQELAFFCKVPEKM